jgi:hypothetical protein
MEVTLNGAEIVVLMEQDSSEAQKGGWQALLDRLQKGLNQKTGKLIISGEDLPRIPQYAFDYGNGGWERKLKAIFERTLGPDLGR